MQAAALVIKWLGHACFLITTVYGSHIVIDPFGEGLGYKPPAVEADVVFVSHAHFDHNAVNVLKGNPKVIGPTPAKPGVVKIRNEKIAYQSIPTYHDSCKGKERGTNTVRVIEVEGIRICHLGDIGHKLSKEQLKAIGHVDVLMIPVGGKYTIDGKQALEVTKSISPRYVIPMHYKTPALKMALYTADTFLAGFKQVKHLEELSISKNEKKAEPATVAIVLNY